MAKLCYVVHRYPPYPGGSEYYVQAMAEESQRRGHDVTVFTEMHAGDLNGVKVRSSLTQEEWNSFNLIIVHGADVHYQNYVLSFAGLVKAPVLYMIIKPTESLVGLSAMRDCPFLGYSTQEDWKHIQKHGHTQKAVSIRHSIPSPVEETLGIKGAFRKKYGIKTPYMFLTAGGFWHHKGMTELAETFNKLGRDDVTLVCLGYMNENLAPNSEGNVLSYLVEDRRDVVNAIADADLYIMNSTEEGFGLVLLESMLNKTPWAARKIAGAIELQQWGYTYHDVGSLQKYMSKFLDGWRELYHTEDSLEAGHKYILENRLIKNTVDDIEAVLKKC
jgi:glycosyltransferase involved in cell wall biosynthesis